METTLKIANEYGSVKVWELPKGYEHVRGARLQPLCRRLGVKYAPALVGWRKWGGYWPEFDGVVVTRRSAVKLKQAIAEREERAEARTAKLARRLLKSVEDMVIEVPVLNREELMRRVFQPGATRVEEKLGKVVRHIQRQLMSFKSDLYRLKGQPGADDASRLLHQRYLDAIAQSYPWLAEACQLEARRLEHKRREEEWLDSFQSTLCRPEALKGYFERPGFTLQLAQFAEGPVDVRVTGVCGAAYASIGDRGFLELAKSCCKSREVEPLLEWLVGKRVGARPFQTVVGRCESGEAGRLFQEQLEERRQREEAKRLPAGVSFFRRFEEVVPGFEMTVSYGGHDSVIVIFASSGSRGRGCVAQTGLREPELLELARGGADGQQLLNWLAEQDVGRERFRVAVRFFSRGDVEGWKSYLRGSRTNSCSSADVA